MMNRVAQEYGPTIDWSKFSPQGTNVQGGNAYDKKAGDAVWNQFESRNEPLFQRQQAQMDATLRNRGLKPGDEAYDQQMKEMGQQQTDARQQAQNQATTMAGQEGSRMQQMDIGASGFNTQNRQQQIAEEMQKRGFSLNEINALLTGQQVQNPNMPSFQNATKADTTQYLPAAQQQYQSGLDSANSQNAFMGSVLGAVASPFSFSPFG
jgi:hypothetical protein